MAQFVIYYYVLFKNLLKDVRKFVPTNFLSPFRVFGFKQEPFCESKFTFNVFYLQKDKFDRSWFLTTIHKTLYYGAITACQNGEKSFVELWKKVDSIALPGQLWVKIASILHILGKIDYRVF